MDNVPFVSVEKAATVSGLAQCYIRKECKAGNIPHIMVGRTIKINLPLFLAALDKLSTKGC